MEEEKGMREKTLKKSPIKVLGSADRKRPLLLRLSVHKKNGNENEEVSYKGGELHELIGATIRLLLSSIYT